MKHTNSATLDFNNFSKPDLEQWLKQLSKELKLDWPSDTNDISKIVPKLFDEITQKQITDLKIPPIGFRNINKNQFALINPGAAALIHELPLITNLPREKWQTLILSLSGRPLSHLHINALYQDPQKIQDSVQMLLDLCQKHAPQIKISIISLGLSETNIEKFESIVNEWSHQPLIEQITIDPLAQGLLTGKPVRLWQSIAKWLQNKDMNLKIFISSQELQNAGLEITRELSLTLSKAHETIHQLQQQGLDTDQILSSIAFNLSTGSHFFLEIAKLRSIRQLWSLVLQPYGETSQIPIYTQNAYWNKSTLDSQTNILRSSLETQAAFLGGADYIATLPYNYLTDPLDPFANRIAINTFLIFEKESYLNQVSDPLAGSYLIEQLTENLASLSWKRFQEIEANGGFLANLESGAIQQEITSGQQKKQEQFKNQQSTLIGVNLFPNAMENQKTKASTPILIHSTENNPKQIQLFRLAEEIEAQKT